jgi:hypothetical protein
MILFCSIKRLTQLTEFYASLWQDEKSVGPVPKRDGVSIMVAVCTGGD